ncbi:MAG: hypothetical protein ACLU4P_05860 [Ruminococcus sp.]
MKQAENRQGQEGRVRIILSADNYLEYHDILMESPWQRPAKFMDLTTREQSSPLQETHLYRHVRDAGIVPVCMGSINLRVSSLSGRHLRIFPTRTNICNGISQKTSEVLRANCDFAK